MGYERVNFTYLSTILEIPLTVQPDGRPIGKVLDLAATTTHVYPKVTGIVARLKGHRQPAYIPWNIVKPGSFTHAITLTQFPGSDSPLGPAPENEILLGKSFLDKQIISTSGHKVVRVNDLHLLIDNTAKDSPNLFLVHIDIGIKGLLRRLGFLPFVSAVFTWIVSRDIKDQLLPWKNVQPTTTTSVSGSLHLKTDASKLEEIHPADLADILEDLGSDERTSLVESLEPSVAALMFKEMSLRLQLQVCESLEIERLAGIITEMQTDDAVDLLDELPPARRNALYGSLPPDRVQELRELSRLSVHGVGSIMNTDAITAPRSKTAGEILQTIRTEAETAEVIYYVFIVDDALQLQGVVSLRHLLTALPDTRVSEIMTTSIISVPLDASIKQAARLFFKYNFDALPVVDDDGKLRGIVSLRDTLLSTFPEMRED
jgi:CBS domain-containing protein